LIDESAGRAAVKRLGLVPVGVLGTLLKAKQRGYIDSLAPLIDRLQNELRFFISPKVRSEVLRLAGE
jgi:predicted nucleic acid-binding protein